jgi:PAS domain S-box-containing protein
METLHVLHLEDSQDDSALIRAALEFEWKDLELLRVETREAFVRALEEFKPDIVLCEIQLPVFDGESALKLVRQVHPEIPVIIVATALGENEAIDLIKMGAKDCILKSRLQSLTFAVYAALTQEQGIRARKRVEQALRENEPRYQAIMATANDAIICSKPTGVVYLWNRKAEDMFGFTAEEAIGRNLYELISPEHYREPALRALKQFAQTGAGPIVGKTVQLTARRKDGGEFPVELSVSAMQIGGEWHTTGIVRDITERKQNEAKIQRLNLLYATLSQFNQIIVRSTNEQELFAQICQSAIQAGRFKMAWIGLVDAASRMVVPVASSGAGAEEYLRDIRISVDADSEYGQGPTGIALRENRLSLCQDYLNSPLTASWRERGATLGWRSSAALPLCRNGAVIGAFSLYAGEVNAFDEAVRALLTEMSADIGYALDNLSHEAERRRAEESLRKLSLAVEQSPNSIVITGLDANIEYVNEGFLKATGYSREEVIGKNPRILQSGKTPREAYDDMWIHLTRGEIWKGEFVNRRKDGSEYTESIFASPVHDADGRISHYLGIKEDISERKRAEALLRASEERLQLSQTAAAVGTWEWDLLSGVARCSDSYFSIFGLPHTSSPLTYPEWLERVHPDDRAQAAADIQQVRGTQADYRAVYRIIRADGSVRWLESKARVKRDADGSPLSMLGAVIDITERKQLEEQLVAQYEHVSGINAQLIESNKQLEQAQMQLLQSEKMAAIGLLAAGVAHEINNPIGYVSSNLGTLERYLADIFVVLDKYAEAEALLGAGHPLLQELGQIKAKSNIGHVREDARSLIAESHQGLQRVKDIVLDLRDFSHFSNEEEWVWADVHQGLESTLNVVWNELKYKCDVVKEYGDLPQIYCLPSQLNQVFMNLLVNAAQAIKERGTVTIRTGREGERIWVEVSDTGSGIPPEIIPRLFDPFFTTKPVGKGTGLGLSVSFKIVEKHHGRIEVRSEVGKGATFRVILPVQPDINKENA